MSSPLRLERALRNWQLITFLLVISNTVLVSAYVERAASSRYVPYIVEISPQGTTTYAGPITAVDTPEERLIVQQLRAFIWALRLVVDDPAAQQEMVARAYALADEPVRRQLDRTFSQPDQDPRVIAPKASRAARQITILRLPRTTDTYQVQWTEVTTYRTAYGYQEERSYQGLITVDLARNLPPEALAHNPLGLLVTELTWTETTPDS